jgi:hypothetical protein
MKDILLFSGGADSAYIAYKILTETEDELTTLTLVNPPEGTTSWAPKPRFLTRIDALIEELKKIRNFTSIKKPVLDSEITVENDHAYLYGIEWASSFINDGTYDRFITGRTWEQQNQSLFKGSTLKGTPTYFASINLWNKLVTRGELYDPLVNDDYNVNFNRYDLFNELPDNIKLHTISCHNPSFNEGKTDVIECGNCFKCLWDEKTEEFISKGYTPAQLNAWRRIKALEYGGGNGVSAPMRYWLPIEMGKGDILTVTNKNGDRVKLNTKEKIQNLLQTEDHYTYRDRPKTGIWDFSNLLNGS